MKKILILILMLISLYFKLTAIVKVSKALLKDKKMKGAIITLKVFQSVYNVDSKELQKTFMENVNKFPIDKLEEAILAQNNNLSLIKYDEFKDKLPVVEEDKFLVLNDVMWHSTNTYGYLSCFGKYNMLSSPALKEYSSGQQGYTFSEIYSKSKLKSYFNLLDVDIILLVKVNIDSNFQKAVDLGGVILTYIRPFHSARIMILALDKDLKLVGYNPNYKFYKDLNSSKLNVFVGSYIDKRKLTSGYFIYRDDIKTEIEKMNYFFNELYSDSFKSSNTLDIKDHIYSNIFREVIMSISLDLDISKCEDELKGNSEINKHVRFEY